MLFSNSIMEQLTTIQFSNKCAPEETYFNFRGSFQAAMGFFQAAEKDSTPAGQKVRLHRTPDDSAEWCGFGKQTLKSVYESSIIDAAFSAFNAAKASIETNMSRGRIQPAIVGQAWDIGRVITGHPYCALQRPKTKLPIKRLNLAINCSVLMGPGALAEPLVRIARAAWEYMGKGGIVELTANYCYTFSKPQIYNGVAHHGIVITVKVPLTNGATIASACSVQFYRGIAMPFAVYLSGAAPDFLPLNNWTKPDVFPLNGKPENTERILKTLSIA